jgi:16S rRNA (guanine527-N7)-methyltransferase
LLDWWKITRLVGSCEPVWIVEQLVLDSLLFLRVLPSRFRSMIDIGSGAGIPGIPLKIVRPDCRVVLVESRRRRASFLAAVRRELGLVDCEIISTRVEEVVSTLGGHFDVAVMRCAGDVGVMAPLALELVAPGGVVAVSGPPSGGLVDGGRLVEVPGVAPGTKRRFIVLPKASCGPQGDGRHFP